LAKRKDISERIVYQSRPIGSDPTIPILVDGSKYHIEVVIAFFHKPKPTRIFPDPDWMASLLYTSQDILNLKNRLNHLQPPIAAKELYRLLQDGIRKGLFTPLSDDNFTIRMFITADSWLNLQPINKESKWVVTTLATVNKVIRKQSAEVN
jgi:hypothetical protein